VHGLHALRGLHGESGDGCNAIAIIGRKRFQVGADAGAAGRIETGDGQNDGKRVVLEIVQRAVPSAPGKVL
jgi:hypothetical protein